MRTRLASSLLFVLALPAEPAAAQVCNVPSERSSIRAAVLDPDCMVVNVAFGSYVESVAVHRGVWINGASTATTLIRGRVLVRGAGTDLQLSNLSVDARGGTAGCYDAIEVASGSGVRPSAVATVGGASASAACPLFADSLDYGL
jgi:hypothetical protein